MSRSTEARSKAAIYRKAAMLLEDGALHSGERNTPVKHSCCAVAKAEGIFPEWNYGHVESRLVDEYYEIFNGNFGPYWEQRNQDVRILALCFMAAMVEAGDA